MAYSNIKGTTCPSFKIGPNGVSLSSSAVVGSTIPAKYLKTNQVDAEGNPLYLLFTDDPAAYDSYIKNSDISSITYLSNSLVISMKDGTTFTLSKTIVSGPSSSTDEAIALFDGTTGSVLKDSGKKISENIEEASTETMDSVPTTGAVIGYIGVLSDALKQRLNGSL